MIFEKIKSNGLAHLSYFIGSKGEAAVIDPRRDCDAYLKISEKEEMRIRYIFETHRNEDYVSGSLELASKCGARILHGDKLNFKFGEPISDGQEFKLGALRMEAIHTPGHTLEHMSYLVKDPRINDQSLILFSGDALFVGDTGRTDFYGKENDEKMASLLYESVFDRLLPLGDGVILAPAHGAGSVCGGNISAREISTLGIEKATNPILQMDRRSFVEMKMNERHEYPKYFRMMEKMNIEGPSLVSVLPDLVPLSPVEFLEQMNKGAIVIDTRSPPSFSGVYIKGSYSMWREGIPSFAGCILPYDRKLLLVLEERTDLERVIDYFRRMGFDNIEGYLREGIENWVEGAFPTEHLGLLTVSELKFKLEREEDIKVLDVRSEEDFTGGHVPGAINLYCGHLNDRSDELPLDHPIAIICSVGYRSTLAASILKMSGCVDVYVVLGGTKAWEAAGYPISED
ncbi:MAG: MBL fold metallo-hydrolase [Methanomassiliicoccales archaeon]|nr:MBL fold metallo-hydrolase [Methanomassiliicoccales archaeon]NYT16339.1 MBL fold metallo-hydrolase [Methanomassiliicoccales archaeon]